MDGVLGTHRRFLLPDRRVDVVTDPEGHCPADQLAGGDDVDDAQVLGVEPKAT
jgi:hypothetical protein